MSRGCFATQPRRKVAAGRSPEPTARRCSSARPPTGRACRAASGIPDRSPERSLAAGRHPVASRCRRRSQARFANQPARQDRTVAVPLICINHVAVDGLGSDPLLLAPMSNLAPALRPDYVPGARSSTKIAPAPAHGKRCRRPRTPTRRTACTWRDGSTGQRDFASELGQGREDDPVRAFVPRKRAGACEPSLRPCLRIARARRPPRGCPPPPQPDGVLVPAPDNGTEAVRGRSSAVKVVPPTRTNDCSKKAEREPIDLVGPQSTRRAPTQPAIRYGSSMLEILTTSPVCGA